MTADKVSQLLAGFTVMAVVLLVMYWAWARTMDAWLASWESLAEKAFRPTVTLYCWPHKANHTLPLADVEKIVYSLGGMTSRAYELGRDGETAGAELPCLLNALDAGEVGDYFQFVDLSIDKRTEAEEWTP